MRCVGQLSLRSAGGGSEFSSRRSEPQLPLLLTDKRWRGEKAHSLVISPNGRLAAGVSDGRVCLFDLSTSKRRYLRNLPRVFKGTHVKDRGCVIFPATSVTIECDRQFDVYADGDPIALLPATVGVSRAAIRVIAP